MKNLYLTQKSSQRAALTQNTVNMEEYKNLCTKGMLMKNEFMPRIPITIQTILIAITKKVCDVTFKPLMVVQIWIAVFCVMTPCTTLHGILTQNPTITVSSDTIHTKNGLVCRKRTALKMKVASSSETLSPHGKTT
jgi:hypothetical protein